MKRQPSQEENRLLLLYIFEKIGDMTATQLTRFCMEYEFIAYIDLQLLLAELIDGELIIRSNQHIAIYTLSTQGRETLRLFETRIPHSRREFVDEKAVIWRERFRGERQVRTEVWPTGDGSGSAFAEMVVMEGDTLLFSLRMQAPSARDARQLCARFREQSAQVYQTILEELLKEGE